MIAMMFTFISLYDPSNVSQSVAAISGAPLQQQAFTYHFFVSRYDAFQHNIKLKPCNSKKLYL
jgi:hypothetical protein